MDLDNILNRRALRLKAELTEGDRPEPSFLSAIYPAMDYGENSPPTLKTPVSIPCSNDAEAKEADCEPEKGQKEVDEPGPSKTTSSSLPVVPGQSAMVPDAHKRAAFELGYFGENRSERFIKRCVELITGVKKVEQEDPTEGGDVDVSGSNGHGKGHNYDSDEGGCSGGCGPDCDCKDCKAKYNKSSGSKADGSHDYSKLSAVIKKLGKSKPSYG